MALYQCHLSLHLCHLINILWGSGWVYGAAFKQGCLGKWVRLYFLLVEHTSWVAFLNSVLSAPALFRKWKTIGNCNQEVNRNRNSFARKFNWRKEIRTDLSPSEIKHWLSLTIYFTILQKYNIGGITQVKQFPIKEGN